jgi:pyruvate kinase
MDKYSGQDMIRKTKMVCTIGPASDSEQMIEKLIRAGMNVARLNFSHGTYAQHASSIKIIRKISTRLNLPIAVLQDLPGPKVRTGALKQGEVLLKDGNEFVLSTRKFTGDEHMVSVNLPSFSDDVKEGDRIFLNDGAIALIVLDSSDTEVRCKVINGGVLSAEKGVNVPDVRLSVSSVTVNDLEHLIFGLEQGVDYVALSFVRGADDIIGVRKFLRERDDNVPLIAKIEKHEAVENIDEIITEADGIMIARGDLGVEIPLTTVPLLQKEIISKCNRLGKPVIVATQMLESMIHSPRPTRAEASDVANAILDGADAVMLSGETAVGKYPEESALVMRQIALETEKTLPYHSMLSAKADTVVPQTDDAISYAACNIAEQLSAKAIIAYTTSGSTAHRVAKYRPGTPILAITTRDRIRRRLSLYWGIYSFRTDEYTRLEDIFRQGVQLAIKSGLAKEDDLIVVTAGVPIGIPGNTNMLKVQRID